MTTEAQAEASPETATDQSSRTGAARGKPRVISNPNDVAGLVGDEGNDVIRGGPETSPTETDHDWLLGGAGVDQLLGGAGIGTKVPLHPSRHGRNVLLLLAA